MNSSALGSLTFDSSVFLLLKLKSVGGPRARSHLLHLVLTMQVNKRSLTLYIHKPSEKRGATRATEVETHLRQTGEPDKSVRSTSTLRSPEREENVRQLFEPRILVDLISYNQTW